MTSVQRTFTLLDAHMKAFPGQCLRSGTFAGDEFDRLYVVWIRARWDSADTWVRSVWSVRP